MSEPQQSILDYLAAYRSHRAACEHLGALAGKLADAAARLRERRTKAASAGLGVEGLDPWPALADLQKAVDDCQRFAEAARTWYYKVEEPLRHGLAEPPREPAS